MKKTTIILSFVLGLWFVLPSAVLAINPMHFNGLALNINSDIYVEKDIMLQDWMLRIEPFKGSPDITSDLEPEVKPWMLDASWIKDNSRLTPEPEMKLEGWMLNPLDTENRTIALENWMLQIPDQG